MPLTHKPAAQSGKVPQLFPGVSNVFLGDVVATKSPDAPIAAGLFRMEKGEPLKYEYTYDEAKIILEGECTITDEEGTTVTARPGDIFLFPKGSNITFESEDYMLAFYCGQRPQL
ncbi:RmlC-like cupin domain-containing protein [Bombardia bombarda]|uniref:RmlC-like cupin domain-containing protein n=1 Tax=Bombardia bombarda TaxID=252184 RepID=A0AA39X8V4_9PEZI|nr:RmlC-like cupin domain-containing protein [Bombardia bombarda]